MGSKRRQAAIAAGQPVENAEAARRRRRALASVVREDIALELYVRGKRSVEIEDELQAQTGSRCHGNIPELIRRGVYRRLQANRQTVEEAKQMMLAQYRPLLETYLPRALGETTDPETGERLPPDVRAAELVLKVLDKVGQVTGAMAPPRAGDLNLNLNIGGPPPDADTARRLALEQLDRQRQKLLEIEGQLGDTPAVEGGGEDAGDALPPPFDLPPPPTD